MGGREVKIANEKSEKTSGLAKEINKNGISIDTDSNRNAKNRQTEVHLSIGNSKLLGVG